MGIRRIKLKNNRVITTSAATAMLNNTFTYTISANVSNPVEASGVPISASVAFNDGYATQGTVAKNTTASQRTSKHALTISVNYSNLARTNPAGSRPSL